MRHVASSHRDQEVHALCELIVLRWPELAQVFAKLTHQSLLQAPTRVVQTLFDRGSRHLKKLGNLALGTVRYVVQGDRKAVALGKPIHLGTQELSELRGLDDVSRRRHIITCVQGRI